MREEPGILGRFAESQLHKVGGSCLGPRSDKAGDHNSDVLAPRPADGWVVGWVAWVELS